MAIYAGSDSFRICAFLILPLLTHTIGSNTAPPEASLPRRLPSSVCSKGRVRYFAFGSNLLRSKMDGRGETEVLESVPGVVHGHRLAFNMRMFPPLEPAMASIEPCSGDVCEGALYTLTQDGYEALWKSEGGAMPRPGYEEVVVNVSVGDKIVQAITLRAAPWIRLKHDVPPSQRYKNLIVDGAKEIGLSDTYIKRVSEMPAISPSAALTAIARAHGVIAVLAFRLRLRKMLSLHRAACYALLRFKGRGTGIGGRLLDLSTEVATCTVLLPTATVGFLIRFILRLCGREKWVQMGPPPSKQQKPESSTK